MVRCSISFEISWMKSTATSWREVFKRLFNVKTKRLRIWFNPNFQKPEWLSTHTNCKSSKRKSQAVATIANAHCQTSQTRYRMQRWHSAAAQGKSLNSWGTWALTHWLLLSKIIHSPERAWWWWSDMRRNWQKSKRPVIARCSRCEWLWTERETSLMRM